jgi:hypothetical protein
MTVATIEIMTTTITDEQKTEFCCDLHTIIDLVNSLQRSIKLTELESENGSLNSDSALVEHIGGALGDFLEKFEGLPANI